MALPKECSVCEAKLSRSNRASTHPDTMAGRDFADLCVPCYEIAGLENEHADGHHAEEVSPDCPNCAEEQAAEEAAEVAQRPATKKISNNSVKMEMSKAKARKLLADAQGFGWDVFRWDEDAELERFAMHLRNEATGESIDIAWSAGVCEPHIPYSHAGRIIKLKNASAARKRMSQEPDVIAPRRSRPSPNEDGTERAARVLQRSVPFDMASASEKDIFAAVAGRKIVWINSISGLPEEATVTGKKQIRIVNGAAGRPILTFVDAFMTGFRSVALEAILQVV